MTKNLFGAAIRLSLCFGMLTAFQVIPTVSAETLQFDETIFPYVKTFLISAYYSPLPDQEYYYTGSFDGDKRLNGNGVSAADGTPVYPGMAAAPVTYPFGTKLKVPGLGVLTIHDRGGAIVKSGQRGNAHDRLDIWMGAGEEGLRRALSWGKRTVDVEVLGIDSTIADSFELDNFSTDFTLPTTSTTPSVQPTPTALFSEIPQYGDEGEHVKKLQEVLKEKNFYSGEISAVFDEPTRIALVDLQKSASIIQSEEEYGAGYVGPKTIKVLASSDFVSQAHAQEKTVQTFAEFTKDLALGDEGEEVKKLQMELRKLHLLGVEPSGVYDEVTAHAVFKYQQHSEIIGSKDDFGAGVFGPKTRNTLNGTVSERVQRLNFNPVPL